MKITLLIVVGFLVIAGSGFAALMISIRDDVARQYSQASEEPLVDFAHLFAGLIEQDVVDYEIDIARFQQGIESADDREFEAKIYQLIKTEIQTDLYVTNREGIVIFDSDDGRREGKDYSEYNDVYLASQGRYGVRASREDPENSRTTVFYIAAPITVNDEVIGTVTVSRPETAMAPFVEESRASILRASVVTAAAVLVFGSLWAYLVLYPIRNLTRHAVRITRGEQSYLPPTGRGELRQLSVALEEMRRELEGKHYVEHYVQALTHELKSPLSAIRGAAELIDDKMPAAKQRQFLDNILTETTRSENMVRRLVQLAAVESQHQLKERKQLDLAALVREEIEAAQATIETKGLQLRQAGLDDVRPIQGDPLMIRIAVGNALGNAFDFSPPGGEVIVEMTQDPETNGASLRIADDGPGIPDYALDRVFERFYSLKNEVTGRKGSGIGLSFLRATMELHGGSVSLDNREGGGAELRLQLGAP